MMHLNRRQFFGAAGAGASVLGFGSLGLARAEAEGFTLPKLPYAFDALEPSIDAKTMQIHHDLHHGGYVKNLNAALAKHPDLLKKPIEVILKDISTVPEAIRQAVINNGGGHSNHSLFWVMMAPAGKGGKPSAALTKAIDAAFGSMDKFVEKFNQNAATRFGSGWSWLVVSGGKLEAYSTANQDSPYMKGQTPLLGLDVWEHAYYLKYQNKRPEYVKNWWSVVNWDTVSKRYADAMKG